MEVESGLSASLDPPESDTVPYSVVWIENISPNLGQTVNISLMNLGSVCLLGASMYLAEKCLGYELILAWSVLQR